MSDNNYAPKLRFSEFNGSWELKTLGALAEVTTGNKDTQNKDNSGVYPFFVRSQTVEKINSYSYDGEAILTSGDGVGVGKNFHYINGRFDFHQRVYCIRNFKNQGSGRFIYHYFTERFNKRVMRLSAKNSVDSVRRDMITEMPFRVPCVSEQQKIAAFLTAVDDKIQQLSKKKALLEKYKKCIMQQIFNQEIRFKDENGCAYPAWRVVKLNTIISRFIVPMRDKPVDLSGPVPWCRIEDFNGKYLKVSKSGQGVTINTIKEMNLKVLPVDTLIVSCSANLGFCAIIKSELVTNQTFIGLVPIPEVTDVEFLYYVMKLSARRLNVLSSGTTISYLSRQQFELFPVEMPALAEQTKIANFLSAIDDKIDQVNFQHELTKQYKKGLLQHMLV